jgi:hypothetical protein
MREKVFGTSFQRCANATPHLPRSQPEKNYAVVIDSNRRTTSGGQNAIERCNSLAESQISARVFVHFRRLNYPTDFEVSKAKLAMDHCLLREGLPRSMRAIASCTMV